MSDLTKKILESGLVDETTAKLMERWGYLPEGSADLAVGKAEALERASVEKDTREVLTKMAERIGVEVDALRKTRETMLDLSHLRWPATVMIKSTEGLMHVDSIAALIDRMGRFYFRPQDVDLKWLVPGYRILQFPSMKEETILEVTEIYVGDSVAAVQVSTK
jgi:hypothetical protein